MEYDYKDKECDHDKHKPIQKMWCVICGGCRTVIHHGTLEGYKNKKAGKSCRC